MPLQLSASEEERGAEEYFRARGSAQVLEKAQFGQGKSKEIQAFFLDGLCSGWARFGWIWLNLDWAWPNFNMNNME
jgi:hypothetical protein